MNVSARRLAPAGLLGLALIVGCTGLRQASFDSAELYRARTLNAAHLKEGRVVILIATGAAQMTYRRLLSDAMVRAWKEVAQEIPVVQPFEAISLLNQEGLSEEYGRMMREYEASGIMSKAMLNKLGHAVKVRYVVQPTVVEFVQQRTNRVNVLGIRLVDTREASLRQFVQVWDTQTGAILWEGGGTAVIAGEKVTEKAISFEEIAARLSRQLTRQLLGLPAEKKPPAPSQPSAGP